MTSDVVCQYSHIQHNIRDFSPCFTLTDDVSFLFSAGLDVMFPYSPPCPTCKTSSSRKCTRCDFAAAASGICSYRLLKSLIMISLPLAHSRPPECDEGAAAAASR